jgi:hypothetical protein
MMILVRDCFARHAKSRSIGPRAAGASRSELIRRSVCEAFRLKTKADRTRALRASAGSWKGRSFTGAEYVDARRGDLNVRLRRLGGFRQPAGS